MPKMETPKPAPKRSTKKSSSKKSKPSLRDISLPSESLPGTGPVKDLAGLKSLIDGMPPEAYDKLEPELKSLVDHVKEGNLDKMDERKLRRTLESASKLAHFEISSRGHFQRSGSQSEEAWRAQTEAKQDSDLNRLAEETARYMLTMSDEEWAATGVEKPDFSKPISYSKLVELDRILGKQGIKESDFEQLMTAEELKVPSQEGISNAVNDQRRKSSKTTQKSSKIGDRERKLHGYTQEQLDKATELKLPSLDRVMPKNSRAWKRRVEERDEEEAKKLEADMKLKPGDLARAITAYMKKKDFDGAVAIFNEALMWESEIIGFEPIDLLSINTVISIYCFQNNLDMALKTFDLISKYKYQPDQMTYNSFIGLGSTRSDDRVAIEWFNKMREAGVKPDLTTYCGMISVYSQAGHAQEALKWFDAMRAAIPKPDSTPYAHMIHMYGIVLDDLTEAMKWAQRMMQDEVPRNEFTAQVVADLHSRVQEQRRLKAKREQERPKTIQEQFIEAYRQSDSKLVEKLWDSMTYNRAHMPEIIWSTMLSYCSEHAKLELANTIYQQMLEQGIKPSRVTCTTMVQIYRRLGNLELAQSILELIDSAPPSTPITDAFPQAAQIPVPTSSNRSGFFS